ncbi:MAG: hypothetical protein M0P49_01715 [Bacilli bacterium]|nr:hypothetical protein [Bacilli bacterium]
MKNIEETGEKNSNLRELIEICRTNKIRNSKLAELFDRYQASIPDIGNFSTETIPYDELKGFIEWLNTPIIGTEKEFRDTINIIKLSDDIRKILNTKTGSMHSIASKIKVNQTTLLLIKNDVYKHIPKKKTFENLCKGFDLEESNYINM